MFMNKYSVLWTKTAEQDLGYIIDYIAQDSLDRSLEILHTIRTSASALTSMPERGRIVPELKVHGIAIYRELVISPWRMIYRTEGKNVIILTVIDGRRNLEDILLDRLLYSDKQQEKVCFVDFICLVNFVYPVVGVLLSERACRSCRMRFWGGYPGIRSTWGLRTPPAFSCSEEEVACRSGWPLPSAQCMP